jgi:hypothetical protein
MLSPVRDERRKLGSHLGCGYFRNQLPGGLWDERTSRSLGGAALTAVKTTPKIMPLECLGLRSATDFLIAG